MVCWSVGGDFAGGYCVGVSIVDADPNSFGRCYGGAVAASVARALGAGDVAKAERLVWHALVLAVAGAAVLLVIFFSEVKLFAFSGWRRRGAGAISFVRDAFIGGRRFSLVDRHGVGDLPGHGGNAVSCSGDDIQRADSDSFVWMLDSRLDGSARTGDQWRRDFCRRIGGNLVCAVIPQACEK